MHGLVILSIILISIFIIVVFIIAYYYYKPDRITDNSLNPIDSIKSSNNHIPTMYAKCKTNALCGENLICDQNSHRCKQKIGGKCSTNNDCQTGLFCVNWVCVSETSETSEIEEVNGTSEKSKADEINKTSEINEVEEDIRAKSNQITWNETTEIIYI